jgi:hypothetical protein
MLSTSTVGRDWIDDLVDSQLGLNPGTRQDCGNCRTWWTSLNVTECPDCGWVSKSNQLAEESGL